MNRKDAKEIQKALRKVFKSDISSYYTRYQLFMNIITELSNLCRRGTKISHDQFRNEIIWGDATRREREEDCK